MFRLLNGYFVFLEHLRSAESVWQKIRQRGIYVQPKSGAVRVYASSLRTHTQRRALILIELDLESLLLLLLSFAQSSPSSLFLYFVLIAMSAA